VGVEGVRVGVVPGAGCGATLDGGVGGSGELTKERVSVGKRLVGLAFSLSLGVILGVGFGLVVIGVLLIGLLVVHVQACGLLVAVVLLQTDQTGLEDLGVTLGLTGPVVLALVVLTGDLLGLQARLGNGGGDSGSDGTQRKAPSRWVYPVLLSSVISGGRS